MITRLTSLETLTSKIGISLFNKIFKCDYKVVKYAGFMHPSTCFLKVF